MHIVIPRRRTSDRVKILLFTLVPIISFITCNEIEEFFSPSFDDGPAASRAAAASDRNSSASNSGSSGGITGNLEFSVEGRLGEIRSAFPWEYRWIALTIPLSGLRAITGYGFDGSADVGVPLTMRTSVYRAIEAIRCDEPGDYIAVPFSPSLASPDSMITVEAWIRFEGAEEETILSSGPWKGYSLSVLPSGRICVSLPDVSGGSIAAGPLPMTIGQWHEVAFTYDGATETIYLDGMVDTSFALHGAICPHDSTRAVPSMMNPTAEDTAGNFVIRGTIDELRIWKTARTQKQLNDSMDVPLTGAEQGLLACWDMNGTLLDKGSGANHGIAHGRPVFITTTR